MREQALAAVMEHRIGSVFLVARFSDYTPHDTLAPRLAKTVAAYAERGAIVYLVVQAPEQPRFESRQYLRAVLRQRFFGDDATAAVDQQAVPAPNMNAGRHTCDWPSRRTR